MFIIRAKKWKVTHDGSTSDESKDLRLVFADPIMDLIVP